MSLQIGMLVGKDGMTASLEGECRLSIVQKNIGQWREVRSITIAIDTAQGLKGLRHSVRAIIDFLGDCRIFVGRSVTGILYYELEKAKCSVWEMSGQSVDFIDEVLLQEEENQRQSSVEQIEPVLPELSALGNGRYRISVKEIQQNGTGVTTKQILIPVLRRREFSELEIDCTHVPPWIECDLSSGSLQGKIEKLGPNETVVTIYNHAFGVEKF